MSKKMIAILEKMKNNLSEIAELEKARTRLSDEHDPNEMGDESEYSDQEDLGDGFREIGEDGDSEGEDWLRENDPQYGKGDDYEEYGDEEDEDGHIKGIKEDFGDGEKTMVQPENEDEGVLPGQVQGQQEEKVKQGRFRQPSREELVSMRGYTRPFEQRAREMQKLQADPSKNPVLAHQGNIVEARNQHHKDRNSAYQAFVNSDDYKNADPITQMEMDDKFENDWRSNNPDQMKNAMQAHHEAHQKGKAGADLHAAAKDAQIRGILSGGASPDTGMSTEEALQHIGGSKGEEGTEGTIHQDPASSFAMGNQEFIRQYAKDYNNKGKKVANIDDMDNYDEGSQRDIKRILGDGPAKDPKFEQFFAHYYPLIGMSAHRTLRQLGLDNKNPDIDMSMLHEAGMHGLVQAINDYDHDNSSKASFATHAGNKIRGLQLTAMRNQDQIPHEVRQAQKRFMSGGGGQPAQPEQPKMASHELIAKHPQANDMMDRMKRAGVQRAAAPVIRRPAAPKPGGTDGNQ